jgi:hypothetical protein
MLLADEISPLLELKGIAHPQASSLVSRGVWVPDQFSQLLSVLTHSSNLCLFALTLHIVLWVAKLESWKLVISNLKRLQVSGSWCLHLLNVITMIVFVEHALHYTLGLTLLLGSWLFDLQSLTYWLLSLLNNSKV